MTSHSAVKNPAFAGMTSKKRNTRMTAKSLIRCRWADGGNDLYLAYHDEEWGVPLHDDDKLFEFLVLEGAQAGLS